MWITPGLADGEKAPRYIAVITTTCGEKRVLLFYETESLPEDIADNCLRHEPEAKEILVMKTEYVVQLIPARKLYPEKAEVVESEERR